MDNHESHLMFHYHKLVSINHDLWRQRRAEAGNDDDDDDDDDDDVHFYSAWFH